MPTLKFEGEVRKTAQVVNIAVSQVMINRMTRIYTKKLSSHIRLRSS
jgi:hypothetical protein